MIVTVRNRDRQESEASRDGRGEGVRVRTGDVLEENLHRRRGYGSPWLNMGSTIKRSNVVILVYSSMLKSIREGPPTAEEIKGEGPKTMRKRQNF
jgi:hypothetical protein